MNHAGHNKCAGDQTQTPERCFVLHICGPGELQVMLLGSRV